MASKVVERQARVPEVTSSNPAQSWAYFFHAETQHINRIEHFEVCESVTQKSESDLRSQVLAHKLTSTILSRAKLQSKDLTLKIEFNLDLTQARVRRERERDF